MAIPENSRDRSQPFHLVTFRTGPDEAQTFRYTDRVDGYVSPSSGRTRVYISIDRSASMNERVSSAGNVTRYYLARSAALRTLNQIKSRVAAGQVFDLTVSVFAENEFRRVRFGATGNDIEDIKTWLNNFSTSTREADYDNAVSHGVSYFNSAGDFAKSRVWLILSDGLAREGSAEKAHSRMSAVLSRKNAEIPTEVFAFSTGLPATKELRLLDNTDVDTVPTILESFSVVPFKRVLGARGFGDRYEPLAMKLGDITTTSRPGNTSSLRVQVALGSEIADYYRGAPKPGQVYLTIQRGQVEEEIGDFETIWAGRVMSGQVARQEARVDLTCEPLLSSSMKPAPRRRFTVTCNHALYGPECRASLDDATTIFTPNANLLDEEQSRLFFYPGSVNLPQPLSRYTGGIFSWRKGGSFSRLNIVKATSNSLLVNGDARAAYTADACFVALGCSRTPTACSEWHVDATTKGPNIINYGGQTEIPVKNPFGFVQNFY